MPLDEYRTANRDNWDDRVPIHWDSDDYGVRKYVEDPEHISGIVAVDGPLLGDVSGLRLLHLQCHIGTDTISWARRGARVTGVDYSEAALAMARRLSEESGTPARFVLSELYDTPATLLEAFDVVYTGVGAINWLPDIERWATVVAAFLEPGGRFFMREGHPIMWSLDHERGDGALVVRFPYFETEQPMAWDEPTSYAGVGTLANTRTYEWNHGLGEIVNALIDAGLRIDRLIEHRTVEWPAIAQMERTPEGWWQLPASQRDLVPLMYTLMATRM